MRTDEKLRKTLKTPDPKRKEGSGSRTFQDEGAREGLIKRGSGGSREKKAVSGGNMEAYLLQNPPSPGQKSNLRTPKIVQ
jgi:hypothetical protein